MKIGNVVCGGDELVFISGPCSVESEPQIMEAAPHGEGGRRALRSAAAWSSTARARTAAGRGSARRTPSRCKKGLALIVKAGREFGLPTVVEILDAADVPVYEDAGVDCIQIGEPNSKNQALLNRLRTTPLPVIHKRGNSLDTEAYLLWVERMMTGGKENVILCERGIASPNRYTRNTLDVGSIAAFRYQLSGLPVAVDASHGTGIRDLVHPATLAGIMAGASVVLVEAHPNPLIAKSDGFQGLFPEQLRALVKAAQETWKLRRELDQAYLPSAALEKEYLARMDADRTRFFGKR